MTEPATGITQRDLDEWTEDQRRNGARVRREVEPGSVTAQPRAAGLIVRTAKELCELPDPAADAEQVGPVIVRGARSVVGGHTGEGKTTLALQAGAAVANGTDFLGWKAKPGRVLVIDPEQGLRTAKRRLREAGLAECEELDYLRAPEGLRLDADDGELPEIEATIAEREHALVIADAIYKLSVADSNDERQVVEFMRRLDALRDRYGFALLLTSHVRKRQPQSGRFAIDDIFGSGAFLRGAEVVLGLQRTRPGHARLHFFKDRDGDLPVGESWKLLFDRERGFHRDPEDGNARPTAAERIRELVGADPGITSEALMKATGYAERTVRSALRELGAVGSGKPKRWELPAEQEGLL
jgi:hypothetical protein